MGKNQNIGVFGIGAIGSVIAFELYSTNSSNVVSYYNRSPKKNILHKRGNEKSEIAISLKGFNQENSNLDWLIVCIKEHHFPEARASLEKLIGPNTKIAVIRNGLKLGEPFLNFTEESHILECCIDCSSQKNPDGYYESLNDPIITIPTGSLANGFEALFKNSKTIINQTQDFHSISWKKLCESSAFGSILCISGETAWIFQDEKIQRLYLEIMNESLLVAKADGALIEDDFIDSNLKKVLAYPHYKGSSMLTDKLNGTKIELGAKNGIIIEIGQQYGIKTPTNDRVISQINEINKN